LAGMAGIRSWGIMTAIPTLEEESLYTHSLPDAM